MSNFLITQTGFLIPGLFYVTCLRIFFIHLSVPAHLSRLPLLRSKVKGSGDQSIDLSLSRSVNTLTECFHLELKWTNENLTSFRKSEEMSSHCIIISIFKMLKQCLSLIILYKPILITFLNIESSLHHRTEEIRALSIKALCWLDGVRSIKSSLSGW